MAILFVGSEEFDFVRSGSVTNNVVAARRRASWTRLALVLQSGGTMTTSSFAAQTTVWAGWQGYHYVNNSTNNRLFNFNSVNGARWAVFYNASTQRYYLAKWTGAAYTTLATAAGFVSPNALARYNVKLVVDAAVGQFVLYHEGNEIVRYDGDTRAGAANVDVSVVAAGWYGADVGNFWEGVSECVVATEDCRLWNILAATPNAAASANTFTAGAYTDVNEAALSDATVLTSATPEQEVTLPLANLPAGDFVVKGVVAAARCADGVGGMGIQVGIKTNGSVYLGEQVNLSATFQRIQEIWDTNPNTLNRFTLAEIDALELALHSKAV